MVNHGRSHGCGTCKRRRVKCDETFPRCQQCSRLKVRCEGYHGKVLKIRFKDQTSHYSKSHQKRSGSGTQGPNDRPGKPSDVDSAVSFFIKHVTTNGRSAESSRGYLDQIPSVLSKEKPDSALQAAIEAVAFKIWAHLTHGKSVATHAKLIDRAVTRLRSAIANPVVRSSDGTVISALLLQLHDTLSTLFNQDEGSTAHLEGAIALIQAERDFSTVSRFYPKLLASALHHKVSAHFRHGTQLPTRELDWLETYVIPVLPSNPSSRLDIIGLCIVQLQHSIRDNAETGINALEKQTLLGSISRIDAQLEGWLEGLPELWYPIKIERKRLGAAIPLYRRACDVYPSVHIATICNVWRIYRLSLMRTRFQLGSASAPASGTTSTSIDKSPARQHYQQLLDDICYSIPFYLGDRIEPLTLSDVDSCRHKFPSYHDLSRTNAAVRRYRDSSNYLSRADHHSHVALQGPFHLSSILSHLVTTCGPYSRPDQLQWLTEQLGRTLHLLRVNPGPVEGEVTRRLRTIHVL